VVSCLGTKEYEAHHTEWMTFCEQSFLTQRHRRRHHRRHHCVSAKDNIHRCEVFTPMRCNQVAVECLRKKRQKGARLVKSMHKIMRRRGAVTCHHTPSSNREDRRQMKKEEHTEAELGLLCCFQGSLFKFNIGATIPFTGREYLLCAYD
jgi:hypothetical protein